MRYASKRSAPAAECDMTPMIDLTFLLIAFFMVLINFAETDQNERIRLPSSELAKPPDGPLEAAITLQLTRLGTVLFAGDETTVEGLRPTLLVERQVIDVTPGRSASQVTIIIRGDRDAQAGVVQELIQVCQETGFEKFALRAKQQQRERT